MAIQTKSKTAILIIQNITQTQIIITIKRVKNVMFLKRVKNVKKVTIYFTTKSQRLSLNLNGRTILTPNLMICL